MMNLHASSVIRTGVESCVESCKEGYGYDIASDNLTCVPCNNDSVLDYIQAWSALLSTRFLPLTIMVAVFLLFDIDILSGSMQSFIFYSQMLSYLSPLLGKGVELQPAVKTMLELSHMLYDIWKLRFGAFLLETTRLGAPPVCTQLSALSLKCLGYITALYPFILIYTIWFLKALQDRGCCCGPCKRLLRKARVAIHRLRRKWSPNSTIIHGLSSIHCFSYTSFLITSVYLVTPNILTKEEDYVVTTHVHYDGSIAFASLRHLPYMICAILVLFTFVAIPPSSSSWSPWYPERLSTCNLRGLTDSFGSVTKCLLDQSGSSSWTRSREGLNPSSPSSLGCSSFTELPSLLPTPSHMD